MNAMVCQCLHGGVLPDGVRRELLAALDTISVRWTVVPDLCGAAARREPWLGRWFGGGDEPRVILACHPRAVRWLLRWAGMPAEAVAAARVFDLREEPVADAVCALRGLAGEGPALARTDVPDEPGWIPWFPVMDRDRCTHCHQCRNFCPFGVYGTGEDGRVEVQNPSHCKTNCPACARLCPQLAIIFPKHNQGPIDGAAVTEADMAQRREAQLEKRLKKEDIHSILARRRGAAATRKEPA
jgi:Pyruvate/2-oxoacid:ferredoxin oxidoreductase delta subunit